VPLVACFVDERVFLGGTEVVTLGALELSGRSSILDFLAFQDEFPAARDSFGLFSEAGVALIELPLSLELSDNSGSSEI
jgi:hypothetical protein